MKIRSRHLTPIILTFFVIGIAGTMVLNLWNTEKEKVPAKYKSGDFGGQYDPGDIRGSYTFADINKAFNIPVEELAKAFGFSDAENPAALKAKDVEGRYGKMEEGELGTDSIRLFVAYYKGLPFKPEHETLIPERAVSILKANAVLTEEQKEYLNEMTISLSNVKQSTSEAPAEATAEHKTTEEFTIKGKTTFQELLDFGITKEEIEQILGMPMGRGAETVRDYVADKNMEFSELKPKFEALVESKK